MSIVRTAERDWSGIMSDLKPCPFCGNDALSIDSSYFRDTLIYCCECDMYFTLDSFKATREDVFETWNTRAERKWIPVSEALPDTNNDVLLQFSSNMGVGYFEDGYWCIVTGEDLYCGLDDDEEKPIAWMPLPEPYRGDR